MISPDAIFQLQGVLGASGIYVDNPASGVLDQHTLDAVAVLRGSGQPENIQDFQHMLNLMGVDPKLVEDGDFGPATERAWQQVVSASNSPVTGNPVTAPTGAGQPADGTILSGDGTWPYVWCVDGDDLVAGTMKDGCFTPGGIVITSFGGWGGGNISDPQDNGETASGKNTKQQALSGVSLAMDPEDYPEMKANDPRGYAALVGAPLPRLPWGMLVTVNVNGVDTTPPDGIIDLGPGRKASKPGEPHGCDLTPIAAHLVLPSVSVSRAANAFEVRGSVRAHGAAKFVH